jgi:hypothetical protein
MEHGNDDDESLASDGMRDSLARLPTDTEEVKVLYPLGDSTEWDRKILFRHFIDIAESNLNLLCY